MHPRLFSRVTRIAVAALLLLAVGAQTAAARPQPGARRSRGFDLFAGPFQYFLVNRVYCGINALGEFCVDPTNSSTIAGGFWPRGTPNAYIFNSGLQLAGVVAADAGFAWAGDTVGAFFFDARGDQAVGEAIINLHSSLDAADVATWPVAGIVRDTSIYDAALVYDKNGVPLNRPAVSQQDIWGRSWDGNTNLGAGREHPMGILTDTRAMAWSFPSGNEDILYFVFDFYNITASDPAAYSSLDPEVRDDIAAIGAQWQANSEQAYGVDIPAGGYTITDAYAAFGMDPDVDEAGANNSTAILPFSLATAYKTNWVSETGFAYPPDVHGPPFANAPGMVGVKYLKSPRDPDTGIEFGLSMFSNTLNSATGFPDALGVQQLWRYLSGRVSSAAGDNSCTVPNPIEARLCYLDQSPQDTRFYLSSGPFALVPGQKFTIVVAYVLAAVPAAAVTIGDDMAPGIPPSPGDLATGAETERPIDRAAGWVSHSDVNGNGVLEQYEVETFPRSLLNKSLVAQEVFDKKFLLPAPPDAPNFFLVPGNNQVTVVWEPSATEGAGDPFFGIASDPTSALFDPNFRQFDVEGYKIYRGRSQSDLTLIAQFDYSGTFFRDYTGGVVAGGNCAPELNITDDCLEDFDFPISNTGDYHDFDISGDLIQVPAGGRVELADGSVFVVNADTAGKTNVANDHTLANTGVPFAFVDRGVINSVTYVYSVTAYDINAVNSGPTSLESAQILKNIVPRAPAGNASPAVVSLQKIEGDDGVALDLDAPWPTIDPEDGTFSGNIPPLKDGTFGFLAAVSEALPPGDISLRIDSVGKGFQGGFGPDPSLYVTMEAGGNVVQASTNTLQPGFSSGSSSAYSLSAPLVPYDSTLSDLMGLDFVGSAVRMPVEFKGVSVPFAYVSPSVATGSGRYGVEGYEASRYLGHSRWFDEGGSEPPDPTINGRADSAHNSGTLTGVGRIWAPSAYRTDLAFVSASLRGYDATSVGWYPADFVVTWGAGGSGGRRDVTHNVNTPPTTGSNTGYGFMNLSNVLATGIDQAGFEFEFDLTGSGVYNILNYQLLLAVEPACSDYWGVVTFDCIELSPTAELSPLDFESDGVEDATGIIFILNGESFFMEMAALPAAGTEWHLRAVAGIMTADCTPALGETMTDCTNYTFAPNPAQATNVPGLKYVISVEQQYAVNAADSVDLSLVHTVPDPYYVTNNMEITTNRKILKFVNLPAQAIIRIYSLSGVLVDIVEHNDPAGGGETTWDLRNRNNQFVASGVYFYHIETPNGQTRTGRFTVVNFAQ